MNWWQCTLPHGWSSARLRDVVSITNGFPFDSSAFSSTAGMPLIRIRDLVGGFTGTYVTGPIPPAARVVPGDLIIGMDGDFTAIEWSGPPAALNQRLCLLRARPPLLDRFLRYMIGTPLRDINDLASSTTVKHLSSADLYGIRIPLPSPALQQDIVDFLDLETARVDSLIVKKRRMVNVLQARREASIEESIRGLVETYGSSSLKYAARRIEVGIVITPSAWYADEGVLALRGLNIKPGQIDLDDVVHLSHEGNRLHVKSILHAGDVVVVRTGQAGAAAVVPSELDGCNCIDLVIVRPSRKVDPKFLEFVINSDWTQKHVDEYSVGSIQSHFNVGAMKEVRIPLPPLQEQLQVVEILTANTIATTQITRKLHEQIDLLVEQREALITAAVTGEFDLGGASAA